MTQPRDTIAGLVLAGGKSRRMGADKAFLMLNGRPLLAHVIERARSQVDTLLISANDDPQRYAVWDAPVLADAFGQLGAIGPLAGIFTALVWLRAKRPDVRWLAAFACDTPFFSSDLTVRLHGAAVEANVAVAIPCSGGRMHPLLALIRADIPIPPPLPESFGEKRAQTWTTSLPHTYVEFDTRGFDPFFNINMPADLVEAERILADRPAG